MENYGRFYALFNRLPYKGDREEFKKSVVMQYTWNRTEHLHEMTEQEYNDCCAGMEKMLPTAYAPGVVARWPATNAVGAKVWSANSIAYYERKKRRSSALHQLQLYGIDTTDWNKVNEFCKQPRIAGKAFRDLDCEELEALTRKMRAIIRKRDKGE